MPLLIGLMLYGLKWKHMINCLLLSIFNTILSRKWRFFTKEKIRRMIFIYFITFQFSLDYIAGLLTCEGADQKRHYRHHEDRLNLVNLHPGDFPYELSLVPFIVLVFKDSVEKVVLSNCQNWSDSKDTKITIRYTFSLSRKYTWWMAGSVAPWGVLSKFLM